MPTIQRSYKYRFYPTKKQIEQLNIEFGHARFVWNWALDMRTKAYKRRKDSMNFASMGLVLTKLKRSKRYDWLYDATAACHQQKLRDMDRAFVNFYNGRTKYPRFKKKFSSQSIRYILIQEHIVRNYRPNEYLKLPKLGKIKIKWSRIPLGIPKMVTVSRDPSGRYFIGMAIKEEIKPIAKSEKSIGIDAGIKDLFVCSDGYKSGAPKYFRQYQRKLAHQQRNLCRKKKGSNRYKKQRIKVAKIHAKIKDSRTDFSHKLTTKVINENQVIAIEDLNIKGMLKNKWLSKSIIDSAMHEIRRQLTYKAEWYQRELLITDRWDATSKTCHVCNHKRDKLPLHIRNWTCPECKTRHDRDINAAKNILNFTTARGAESKARGVCTTPKTKVA